MCICTKFEVVNYRKAIIMDIFLLIKSALPQLSRQEKIVADALLEFPELVIEKNITSLSQSIGVSRNTITRFCKALGFQGYTEFKYAVNAYLAQNIKHNSKDSSINMMIESYKQMLDQLITCNLNLKKLATQILKSATIKIIATGKSSPCAEQLKYNLQTLNIYAEVVDKIYYSDDLSYAFQSKDLVIVYTVSGKSSLTNNIVSGAVESKANLFAVTAAKSLPFPTTETYTLPNANKLNQYSISNHLLFYLFNDLLTNQVLQYSKPNKK